MEKCSSAQTVKEMNEGWLELGFKGSSLKTYLLSTELEELEGQKERLLFIPEDISHLTLEGVSIFVWIVFSEILLLMLHVPGENYDLMTLVVIKLGNTVYNEGIIYGKFL